MVKLAIIGTNTGKPLTNMLITTISVRLRCHPSMVPYTMHLSQIAPMHETESATGLFSDYSLIWPIMSMLDITSLT